MTAGFAPRLARMNSMLSREGLTLWRLPLAVPHFRHTRWPSYLMPHPIPVLVERHWSHQSLRRHAKPLAHALAS